MTIRGNTISEVLVASALIALSFSALIQGDLSEIKENSEIRILKGIFEAKVNWPMGLCEKRIELNSDESQGKTLTSANTDSELFSTYVISSRNYTLLRVYVLK